MCGGRVGQGARSHPAAFPDSVSLESEHVRADFRYIYSPNYREGVFSETYIQLYESIFVKIEAKACCMS